MMSESSTPAHDQAQSIYQREGYADRRSYIQALADDHGVDEQIAFMLADMLGPAEDFDGLVSMIEDHAGVW